MSIGCFNHLLSPTPSVCPILLDLPQISSKSSCQYIEILVMSDINLQEVHDYLVDVAKQAGRVVTAARPSTTAAGEKKNSVDLVTETDQATERLITDLVHQKYPHFESASPLLP